MANNGNFGFDGPNWWTSSGGFKPGDLVAYGSSTAHVNTRIFDITDTEHAEAQAAKLQQLLQVKPPVELLDRLDPDYVGTWEIVRIIGAHAVDYAIDFKTTRGRLRVHRDAQETWEECLIRHGLLDA